jgi:hypothetical protein
MSARNGILWISVVVIAMLAAPKASRAQAAGSSDVVAAITQMENDAVKADLAGDKTFYEKALAKSWTGGDSDGSFYTKDEMLKLMSDGDHNKTNSESISDLKVRVYGNTAIATYKDTYDAMFKGQHRARTVIDTDTFVKMGAEWKQVASHASKAK